MKVLAALALALAITHVRADGAHSHSHDHAPAPEHDSGYGAPVIHDTYGPPETTYDAPVTYEHHDVYEPERPDITPYIIACLALVGLSLLFPTFVRIQGVTPMGGAGNGMMGMMGRKKRYAEEAIERSDFVGRTYEIYDHLNQVLDPIDRSCIEKITCEVGSLAYDSGVTSSPILKLVVSFVPGKYGKYMKHFIYAENCHKIKCSAYP